jgi:hypothetical protein
MKTEIMKLIKNSSKKRGRRDKKQVLEGGR